MPQSTVKIPLLEGYTETFLVTPTTHGVKKLLVKSRLETPSIANFPSGFEVHRFENHTLTLEVLPSPTFLGLSENNINTIKIISGIIGFPSLVLLGVAFIFGRRSSARNKDRKEDDKKGIIIIKD